MFESFVRLYNPPVNTLVSDIKISLLETTVVSNSKRQISKIYKKSYQP